ncbi:hypothetical protein RSOLAG1IB_01296 [Rhizoctonia solani AG-1 IB]|uniref:Uncharacterized protein n=1 Tax=Thanatephorus cucumeris (strain AG1-IB / isolate 7/3/14) TaxID=1108050 RepID=A0A0B7FGE8_THACB|nr:hypothetical protein RSOLAG1IB_01296 [Rhizoctonia solani AG-1 IB]
MGRVLPGNQLVGISNGNSPLASDLPPFLNSPSTETTYHIALLGQPTPLHTLTFQLQLQLPHHNSPELKIDR